jgi:cell division protein DivIC
MLKTIKAAQGSKDRGQRRRMRLYVIFMVLFLSWAMYSFVKLQWVLYEKKQELKKVQVQLEQVKKQNQAYQNEIKKLGDKEYIEQLLRSELYMTKEGEKLFLEGQ